MATLTKKNGFTPQTLRALLAFLLIVMAAGSGGLFYLALQQTRSYGIEVNHRLSDAEASLQQLSSLQALKSKLSESESLVLKADQLFATQENYQGQALTDVRNYANTAGLAVANTKLEEGEDGTRQIAVSFAESSVTYSKLINFLNNIEGNVPKMQVTSLPLSRVAGGNSDSVKVGEIKIMIYVR